MQSLNQGTYFGQFQRRINLPNLLLTEAEYTYDYVDWHYHEQAYFTYLLAGQLRETDRKQTHQLQTGSLLYHYREEAHCNHKADLYTRGFHLEINQNWFAQFDQNADQTAGSHLIRHPHQHLLFEQIYRESCLMDEDSPLSIDALVLQLMNHMVCPLVSINQPKPRWIKNLQAILHEEMQVLALDDLAKIVGVHPVYLCQEFSRYFGCTMGEYRRKLKLMTALASMRNAQFSLTEIAYESGFTDQSHFCKVFKQYLGYSPLQYRKKFL